jgi:glutamate-1-semialdehyde 2,1-aminomutase
MTKSELLFSEAETLFPGGVNSPVRSFRAVKTYPRFISHGKGPYITDVDAKEYVDYVLSWGPLLLGHAPQCVLDAVSTAMAKGMSFGAPTELENSLAKTVKRFFPSMELLRFVNSGTEACMGAIRAARASTGRDKILKFSGCYHGHADHLLVSSGSGVSTLCLPDSTGIPASFTMHTFVSPYNDIDAFYDIMEKYGDEIAAVIVEPVAGNMGFVPPKAGFLETIRNLCTQFSSLLIFDEVMTGFRIAKGGAQAYYNIKPDLTCLGKVIGGGMPVGAYGGRRDIMTHIAPLGKMYQAGTLSGNPCAMAAGLAVLDRIENSDSFEKAQQYCTNIVNAINIISQTKKIGLVANGIGTMFGIRFNNNDTEKYATFFRGCMEQGVYFAPSAFEAAFTSCEHGDVELEKTIQAIETVSQII